MLLLAIRPLPDNCFNRKIGKVSSNQVCLEEENISSCVSLGVINASSSIDRLGKWVNVTDHFSVISELMANGRIKSIGIAELRKSEIIAREGRNEFAWMDKIVRSFMNSNEME